MQTPQLTCNIKNHESLKFLFSTRSIRYVKIFYLPQTLLNFICACVSTLLNSSRTDCLQTGFLNILPVFHWLAKLNKQCYWLNHCCCVEMLKQSNVLLVPQSHQSSRFPGESTCKWLTHGSLCILNLRWEEELYNI